MTLAGYACWDQTDALRLLSTEALEGDDALFLATHQPLPPFELGGSHPSLIDEPNERGLLAGLTDPRNRHVFCVVEGHPGSGKSHLIRWLHIKWPDHGKRDLVLLIQRADGSLEGTLQSLRDRLPAQYRSVFEGLERTTQVTEEGRRRDFVTRLANSMEGDYFERPLEDAEWCAQRSIAQILGHAKVAELWGAPHRILQIIAGKSSSGHARDQELARFSLTDVIQIARMDRVLIGLSMASLRWMRRLRKEVDALEVVLETTREDQLVPEVQGDFPETFGLLQALERRMNNAVQELLGATARQLDERFKELRRRLRAEGRRLVLLLEDVTNFQGVDEKLIDALVLNAETREDATFCDLISVLGVTPDYYRRYIEAKANYAQRITQHVRLRSGTDEESGTFPVLLAARYLRAVRAGSDRLKAFDGEGEVFNRCSDCTHRIQCHRAFGEHGGVGFYPLTPRAVDQMYANLRDPSNIMTQQTPRGLIQNILNPTLHNPAALEQGAYPHAAIETAYLPKLQLDGALRAQLEQQDVRVREPLRVLLSWWGEPSRLIGTQSDARGDLLFQGIPRGVFETLGQPWMGDDRAQPGRPPTSWVPTPVAPEEVKVKKRSVTAALKEAQDRDPQTGERDQERPRSGDSAPPLSSEKGALSERQLKKRLEQLARWWDQGESLADAESFWNKWLHRLMSDELDWRLAGASPWLQATLFSESRVMIAGTKKERDHFVAPKEAWLRDGLEAYLTLRTHPAPATDLEFHRYRLLRLVRKLEALAARRVEQMLALDDGSQWSPVALVVQVALARAWLRGTLLPRDPLVKQWAYLFEQEPAPDSSPKKRVESWADMAVRTAPFPTELEHRFRHMVNTPQGRVAPGVHGAAELGVADSSQAIAAMQRLIETLEFSAHPAPHSVKLDAFIQSSLSHADAMSVLHQIPGREARRLRDLASKLEQASPGQSLQEYARRVNEIVREVSATAPGVPADAIRAWSERYAQLSQRGFLSPLASARLQHVDEFKVRASALDLDAMSPADLLGWCIDVPIDDVLEARDMVMQGETSLELIVSHVELVIEGDQSQGSETLAWIHETGAALQQACDALRHAIGGGR